MDKPVKSLAVAYDVQRRNAAKRPSTPIVGPIEFTDNRPGSIAEGILSKRKAALAPIEAEMPLDDIIDDLPLEEPEMAMEAPEPKPVLNRAEAIRARMKALREE